MPGTTVWRLQEIEAPPPLLEGDDGPAERPALDLELPALCPPGAPAVHCGLRSPCPHECPIAPPLDIHALYTRHGGLVRARVRRFYAGPEADDVVQDIFIRAMEKWHTFRGDSSPATWLYQLTTRHCLNRLRDEKRRQELLADEGAPWWGEATAPARQEATALLGQLWNKLDEEVVMIGIYYHLDGMTRDDIATLLGLSRRTIGYRLTALSEAAQSLSGKGNSP